MTTIRYTVQLDKEESKCFCKVMLAFEEEVRDALKRPLPLERFGCSSEEVDSFFGELKYSQSEGKEFRLNITDIAGISVHDWAVTKLSNEKGIFDHRLFEGSKSILEIRKMFEILNKEPLTEDKTDILVGLLLIQNKMRIFGDWFGMSSTNNFREIANGE
jgi:hypothetical protein